MSSKRYEVELKPDALLRRVLLLGGVAALLTGVVLLMRMPAAAPVRLVLSVVYITAGIREIGRFSRGFARVKAIRLAAGEAKIVSRHGRLVPVRIMSGSVVLPRIAWLRIKSPDGLLHAELFRGDATSSLQWRRLQVLWRQGARSFGGVP